MYNTNMTSQAEKRKYSYEERILKKFLRLCPLVSLNSMMNDLSRVIDFRFKTENGILGVELTRCIGENGTKKAEKENFLDSIIAEAQRLYQKQSSLNLWVSVYLCDTEHINKNKAKQLSAEIARILTANFKRIAKTDLEHRRTFRLYLDRNLEGKIYVYNTGVLQINIWKRIKICWVRQHPYTLLQEIIAKKVSKLEHYKHWADKIFLLVTADRGLPPESVFFDEHLSQQCFYSKFDKVFFFDVLNEQIFELHTVPFKYQSNVWRELKKEQRKKKRLKIFT